jgi:hypothetical protein
MAGPPASRRASRLDTPSTPRMLKVLLPMTLPTAMSRSPRSVAMSEVATSGREVPAATMVRPITISLRPRTLAKAHRGITSQLAPSTSSTSPPAISSQLHAPVTVPRRHSAAGERRLRVFVLRRPALAAALPDQEHRVGDQQAEQQRPVRGSMPPSSASEEQQRGAEHDRHFLADQLRRDHQRCDQRRQPRMKSTLKMLLPTTLPSAMSTWPPQAERTETASSGALVPKATTVRPKYQRRDAE